MTDSGILKNALDRRMLLQRGTIAAFGVLTASSLSSCGEQKPKRRPNGEAAELQFHARNVDFGESVLQDFEKTQKLELTVAGFAGDDQLFAKIENGRDEFDLVMPSSAHVRRMIAANMLQPLDPNAIPNLKNIEPAFRAPSFDPKLSFAVPFGWQVLGIGYRKSKVSGTPESWKSIFESDAHKGRIAVLSDAADMFGLYGKYRGTAANALTAKDIAAIEAMMAKQNPHVHSYHNGSASQLLKKNTVDMAIASNGDIARLMKDDPDIGFVIPQEGSLLASVNLCVAKVAKHPKNAHALINHLLDGKNAQTLFKENGLPTPNAAAHTLMGKDYTAIAALTPNVDQLARCEYLEFRSEMEPLFHEAFTRIRAA